MSNDTINTTTEPTITEAGLDATVDGYLACWNTTDAGERAELVARWWAPEAHMTDPLVDVVGHDALAAVFAGRTTSLKALLVSSLGEDAQAHSDSPNA